MTASLPAVPGMPPLTPERRARIEAKRAERDRVAALPPREWLLNTLKATHAAPDVEERLNAFEAEVVAGVADYDLRVLASQEPNLNAQEKRIGELEAEVARLKRVLSEATDQIAEQDSEIGGLYGQVAEAATEARKARKERGALQQRLTDAAMTRTWRLESGKKFVYVEDIAPALLGRDVTPEEAERAFRPTTADTLRTSAEFVRGYCPDHGNHGTAWTCCHCDVATELDRQAKDAEGGEGR